MSIRALLAAVRTYLAPTPPGYCPDCRVRDWRPALLGAQPAKCCRGCTHVIVLSESDFYAEFGTMPRAWAWDQKVQPTSSNSSQEPSQQQ